MFILLWKVNEVLSCKYLGDFVIVSTVSGIWRSNAVNNTTVNLSWTELNQFSTTELNPVSSLLLCRSDSAADKIRWVCFPPTIYLDRCDCTYHAAGIVGPALLSPHLAVTPTPHVTQIHGFVPQPRCLNALYIGRGQQWIQLQAMECHCLLLLDKQHQTQTGLCEPNTIVYWVYCGVFSLLV